MTSRRELRGAGAGGACGPYVRVLLAAALLGVLAVAPVSAQGARQGLLSLDDARLFYEVVGNGPPILVVHGGPGLDHDYLRPGLDVLGSAATLVYYDQRGTGRSEAALDASVISHETFLSDMEELRRTLGYERWTVMGHSFGALLALDYARRFPEHTAGLVLLNAPEPGSRWQTATARRMAEARTPDDSAAMAELATTPGFEARDPSTMSRYFRLAFRGLLRDPARIDEIALDLDPRTARNGPEVARLLGTSMGSVDRWDVLGTVGVPTLVVHGRYDAPPEAMARALVEALPDARLSVLDTGHFAWVEDPAGLLGVVATFLAALDR